jgi:hypothetical protein
MPTRSLTFLILFFAITSNLTAQVDRSAVSGTVTDATGAVVGSATVEAVDLATGFRRSVTTGESGTYQLTALPIGTYKINVSKEGFKSVAIDKVILSAGEERTIDARLDVGGITEQVQVVEAFEPLNRSSAEVGTVIDSAQIREIPVNGRSFATLMMLAPGAINAGGGTERDIRFNGRSRDDNNFTFDGIDASGIQEQPQKAEARLQISLESIAEFHVSTGVYTAESGAAGGGQVNVVSKTGSNQFHGSVFEYLRNNAFDTRSPFDGSTIPPFHMNQFGASLGGPLAQNRAFFYMNYEGLRQHLGQTLLAAVPSASVRDQVITTSPALQPIINALPVGQTHIDGNTDQFSLQTVNALQEDSGMGRLDYRFSDKTNAFFRFSIDNVDSTTPDATGAVSQITNRPQNFVLAFQHIFSAATLNETRLGINRVPYKHPTIGTVPVSISTPGYVGLTSNALDEEVGTTISYIDNLTLTRGRHTFKTGADIRRIRLNNSGNAIDNATASFATLNGFIHNNVDSVSDNAAEGIHGLRRTIYMGYGQDEFKITPNLTLNAGLRYEYYSVAHEVLGRSVVVDIKGCGGVCPAGTPWYSPNTKDFGPRVGIAWAPKAFNGKTVIRTGYGIYYGGNQNDDFSDPMESTALRLSLSSTQVPNLSYPIAPFVSQFQTLGLSPKTIARDRKDSSYQNWNFMIEHQLSRSFVAQLGYVGSVGHHLFSKYTVNLIDPATGTRPLAGFSSFGLKTNDGNSTFNALQFSLQRKLSNGLLWNSQYMWSHALTDASVGAGEATTIQHMACRACDRSSTQFDVRHTLTTSVSYALPLGAGHRLLGQGGALDKIFGGWKVSSLTTARTGLPVNITVSRKAGDLPDGNSSSQRPDLVPGQSIYAANQTIFNWFNPAAFAVPAKGAWGNLGRYAARGPGYYEIDGALEKSFRLVERKSLSFRAEAFNLLNHPIYGTPSGNSSSATFGRIISILNTGATGTGTPRRIQFALRMDF